MSVRGRDALGCGLISPQKRAQEVSILGAEKAHGKWCIEGDSLVEASAGEQRRFSRSSYRANGWWNDWVTGR